MSDMIETPITSNNNERTEETIQQEKLNLIKLIKEWVKNDNEIRELKKEENKRKVENKNITNKLMNLMKNNNIDCFDINDSQIMYKKSNIKKPFSKKHLSKLIYEYYENDVEKANDVQKFITENREASVKEKIVRKIISKPT
jgi:hypothetical protein